MLVDPLPPLLFPGKTRSDRSWLARLEQSGRIRRVAPRLYSSVPASKVPEAVRSGWSTLVSALFPGALLSHRSALEYRPSPRGEIVLTGTTNRELRYPGLTLRFVRGPGPLDDDPPFLAFRASSLSRALLENLQVTRRRADLALPMEDIEKRLEELVAVKGEPELNRLRDRSRQIARDLGWHRGYERLVGIIAALLGTGDANRVTSRQAHARAVGSPYDSSRLARLELLFGSLRHCPLPELVDDSSDSAHFVNKAFFDAYFSNYIEGTTFEVEEAESIVFDGKIPDARPTDAHDILGTHAIVADPNQMRSVPASFHDFERLLALRHRTLMAERPEARPGRYKDRPNRAGSTFFVPPELVRGTLENGFALYQDLPPGMARAIFVMFLVAEVHPFTDGNGRLARIMMNAELFSRGLATIIIPNVYRDDYLGGLRALSRRERAEPLIAMLVKAHQFSHRRYAPYPDALKDLRRRNWFAEPGEAKLVV